MTDNPGVAPVGGFTSTIIAGGTVAPAAGTIVPEKINAPAAAEAAMQQRAALMRDKGFVAKYLSGDVAARQQMENLNKAIAPGEADSIGTAPSDRPAEAQNYALPEGVAPLPFTVPHGTDAARVAQMNHDAHAIVSTLGVERDLAEGAVKMLDRAHAGRMGDDGQARAMDTVELQRMEFSLRSHLGDQYDAAMSRVEAALGKLKPVHAAWLKGAILRSDPNTAAWALQTLAGVGERAR